VERMDWKRKAHRCLIGNELNTEVVGGIRIRVMVLRRGGIA